jgi:putative ABC transport system permease protein
LRDSLTLDVRYALRQAWHHRSSTLAAFLALAIGIAATTAMFAVVNGVLLRPLPIKDGDRVVRIDEINSRSGGPLKVSMTDFLDWKAGLRSFSALALYRNDQGNLTGSRSPERVRTLDCDVSLPSVLGVPPVRGRNFSPEQNQPGRASEALLSWAFWQSEFGGEDVLGRQLSIDGKAYTIIGILPDLAMIFGEASIWLPLSIDLSQPENGRGHHAFFVLGRLRKGVTLSQANRELTALAAALAAEFPTKNEAIGARAYQLRQAIAGNYRPALLLMLGFVACVLLIACGNVASLALARAADREREISVRIALGANAHRLFQQMLTESVVFSTTATMIGVGFAIVLVHGIARLPLRIPLSPNIQIDWRVATFAAAVALFTGVLFGLAPALRALLVQPVEGLKRSGIRSTESRGQQNIKRAFVTLQSAMAALLLIICGLLLRSFLQASSIDPGFDTHNLLTLHVDLPVASEQTGKISLFVRNVLDRIRDIPGVESAAIASDVPLTFHGGAAGVLVEGTAQPKSPFSAPYAQWTFVSPGYFETLRVPFLTGRDFSPHDRSDTPTIAIVNQAFVRQFLGGRRANLRRIALATNPSNYLQVVGVVGDVRQYGIEHESIPELFLSLNQVEVNWLAILLRTHGDPMSYLGQVRNAVQKVDPTIAVFLPNTMQQILTQQKAARSFGTGLVAAFALLAVFLAAQGTYAVISFTVSQRAPEIGTRMALGATDRQILREFTLKGALPVIWGSVLGLSAGLVSARVGATLLYGVSPHDLLSYVAAVLILIAVAIVASYFPARRAALLEPSNALRYE